MKFRKSAQPVGYLLNDPFLLIFNNMSYETIITIQLAVLHAFSKFHTGNGIKCND
jgi:hypothetical protein